MSASSAAAMTRPPGSAGRRSRRSGGKRDGGVRTLFFSKGPTRRKRFNRRWRGPAFVGFAATTPGQNWEWRERSASGGPFFWPQSRSEILLHTDRKGAVKNEPR